MINIYFKIFLNYYNLIKRNTIRFLIYLIIQSRNIELLFRSFINETIKNKILKRKNIHNCRYFRRKKL